MRFPQAVEALQPQLGSSVWVQPPVASTRTAKRTTKEKAATKAPVSSGSTALCLSDVAHIRAGDSIAGSGICADTTVVGVDVKTSVVTLSKATVRQKRDAFFRVCCAAVLFGKYLSVEKTLLV